MSNISNLINFISLTKEEKLMVLKWRNSVHVKEWMYNQTDIKDIEHLNFIDSLINDTQKLYFVLKIKDDYLGVIDFTEITADSCFYGFYSNPNSKTTGIGRILEKASLNYAFTTLNVKKLKLEVFKNNYQVKNLHIKNGFNIISEKIVNKKEVLCMELVNENR